MIMQSQLVKVYYITFCVFVSSSHAFIDVRGQAKVESDSNAEHSKKILNCKNKLTWREVW